MFVVIDALMQVWHFLKGIFCGLLYILHYLVRFFICYQSSLYQSNTNYSPNRAINTNNASVTHLKSSVLLKYRKSDVSI